MSGLGFTRGIPKEVAFLGLSFGVGLACGGGGGGGGTVFDLSDIEAQKTWNILCECYAEAEYSSKQECLDELGEDGRDPAVTECLEGLLPEHPGIQDAANCELNALRTFNICLQGLSCDDFQSPGEYENPKAYYDCFLPFFEDLDACPEIPPESEEAADMCTEWACADGYQTIYVGFVCDGDQDCEDGSDEANCSQVPPQRPLMRALQKEALYFSR